MIKFKLEMEKEEKELIDEKPKTDEKPVGPAELAAFFSLDKKHVYVLVRMKKIPFHKFGHLLRFYISEVREATRINLYKYN